MKHFNYACNIFKSLLFLLCLGALDSSGAQAAEPDIEAAVGDAFRRGSANLQSGVGPDTVPITTRPLSEDGEAIRAWLKDAIENLGRTHTAATSSNTAATAASAKVSLEGVIHWREDGTPRKFVLEKGNTVKGRSAPNVPGATPKDRVITFLEKHRELFRLAKPAAELALIREESDDLGFQHLRFEQRYQNLRVPGKELMAHFDLDGDLGSIENTLLGTPDVPSLVATVGPEEAASKARARIPGGYLGTNSTPELIIYSTEGEPQRLAWSFDVVLGFTKAWRIVVDAETGKTLSQESRIMHQSVPGRGIDILGTSRNLNVWRSGSTYYLIDASKPSFIPGRDPITDPAGVIGILDAKGADVNNLQPTALTLITSSSPTSWTVREGVSGLYGLSQVYDYYRLRHGRNSFDDKGSTIPAIVRVGNYTNAGWNGVAKFMMFGNGLPFVASLDVIGHEVTHAVVQESAGLIYENQPGALNEAFADILGEMVEAMTVGAPDWKIGSQLGQPIRDMRNPSAFRQPESMSEFRYLPNTDAGDHGGVHVNSGIINRAFYLLAAGLNNPIGLVSAERIFYRALTRHLLRQSQFIDARLAVEASAAELFGVNSPEANRAAEAFDAVGIFAAPSSAPPSSLPTVTGPQSYLTIEPTINPSAFNVYRYEEALGDGFSGRRVAQQAARSKLAVDGSGETAIYVTTSYDLAVMPTARPSEVQFLQRPGRVYSVAISPNRRYVSFVLRDSTTGQPRNSIELIDLVGQSSRTINLLIPVVDGQPIDSVEHADAMTFSADSRELLYDFVSLVRFDNGSPQERWSIGAIDLESSRSLIAIPPINGVDIGNPSLSRTSNRYLLFEALVGSSNPSYTSFIFSVDCFTGKLGLIRTNSFSRGGPSYPSFTGDDRAVTFTAPVFGDETSVWKLALSENRLEGIDQPLVVCPGASIGVPYRRGTFIGTNLPPSVILGSIPSQITLGSSYGLTASATDPDGSISRIEFYDGPTLIGTTFNPAGNVYSSTWSPSLLGTHRLVARAFDNLGGATDSVVATVFVTQGRPRLGISRTPGGAFRIEVLNGAGDYELQQSSDLRSWSRVASVSANPVGSIELASFATSASYLRLFRP